MKVLLRLLRISLLLRIIPPTLGLISFAVNAQTVIGLMIAIAVLPALLVLLLSFWLERRGRINPATVRALLFLALLSHTVEFVTSSSTLLIAASRSVLPPEMMIRIRADNGFANLGPTFLLSLVPTVLGAWLDGRRRAFHWAGSAIFLGIMGLAILVGLDNILNLNVFTWRGQLPNAAAYMIVMVVVCFFVGSLADEQREQHMQLEQANVRLAEQAYVRELLAGSQERMRLSRDLHDTVAHTLAALSVQLNAVGAVMAGDQPDAKRELNKARTLVKEGLNSTRHAISDLRANQVADFGLNGALQKLTEAFTERTAVPVNTQLQGEPDQLSPEVANTIYRIAQEALNNIERHAQASQVQLRLALRNGQGNHIALSVADNGVGFAQAVLEDERFGLKGMRERADLIGAHLRVDSALGKGTTVTLQI